MSIGDDLRVVGHLASELAAILEVAIHTKGLYWLKREEYTEEEWRAEFCEIQSRASHLGALLSDRDDLYAALAATRANPVEAVGIWDKSSYCAMVAHIGLDWVLMNDEGTAGDDEIESDFKLDVPWGTRHRCMLEVEAALGLVARPSAKNKTGDAKSRAGRKALGATTKAIRLIKQGLENGTYDRSSISERTGLPVDRVSQLKSDLTAPERQKLRKLNLRKSG